MRHADGNWKLVMAAAVLMASAVHVSIAEAQASPIAVGITAGATKATGDFGDAVDLGYHAGALLEFNGPDLPIGIRADVVYHRFSFKDVDGNANILAGTVNGVYNFATGPGTPVVPYVIGGVGYYHLSVSCSDCTGDDSENKFGLNGGAGLRFPLTGFSAFIEARYHHIFTDSDATNMVPVSFGIVFHP